MPLIFGLMMSEYVFIDQLLLRGMRYGFLFDIDRTLIWWVVFMNCMMSITNVFAERILHLRHLKNGSALLTLMHLFILVISFLFIPENCGWTH